MESTALRKAKALISDVVDWKLPPSGHFFPDESGNEDQNRPMSYETAFGSNGARGVMREKAQNALEFLEQIDENVSIPDGWRLVPIKWTPAMRDAWNKAADHGTYGAKSWFIAVGWEATLNAAPAHPQYEDDCLKAFRKFSDDHPDLAGNADFATFRAAWDARGAALLPPGLRNIR